MPTNEERREVARKLRETSDEIRYWLDTNPYWYVMKCVYGDVEIHDDNELFYRLADLIEPEPERTCTITHAVFNEGDPTGEYEAWNCSHCGELPYDDADSFSYCPCCGTKVTPIPL